MKFICYSVVCLAFWCASAPCAYGQAPAPPETPDQKPGGQQQSGEFRDFDELNLEDQLPHGSTQGRGSAPHFYNVTTQRLGQRRAPN